jgi:oligopeptide transport system permease protein
MNRATSIDTAIMGMATIGIALPSFVIASIAVYVIVFEWPILPAGGFSTGKFNELILPVSCLAAPYTAYIARLTRTGMLEVLNQDYIRTAHAKGLSTNAVIFRHALRGAILPVVSYLGPATAGILTGSLVIESIFWIPGLGTHFVQAALQKDWTLCMGLVMLYTLVLYSLNVLVDIAYTILDPRVKLD